MDANNNREKERQLVQDIQGGNKQAFATLYDNYSGALYGVCKRILEDDDEAQDALQSAMVKVWKNIASYDPKKASLFTWLLNITRNDCIDRIRSKGRKPKIQDLDKSVYAIERSGKSSDQKVPVETIGLREAVAKLKDELRLVINAAYFMGYTQQEIADEFDLPLGTVKTRMRTAIRELRKLFN